jgi:predicted amidohydrolase
MLVGVAQLEPKLGEPERNQEACLRRLEDASARGCRLLVLPECAISGYMFESAQEAVSFAEEIPGPTTEAIEQACRRLGVHCVCGLLERDGDALRNAAILVGPDGLVGHYRKSHLPFLGVDRFVVAGDGPYEVFDTPIGRVGMEICYDLRFPEVTRALALGGAEIVAHPTNWPAPARPLADFMTRARAAENRVFVLTANRVGRETGAVFFGWSQIVDPAGARLAEAPEGEEAVVFAEIEMEEGRTKDIVAVPGEYEVHLFADRRPELYGDLVARAETVQI